RFKNINDQNGHMTGDYVLKELTNFIQNDYFRSKDIFARYGGDEFIFARYGGDEFIILLKDTNKTIAFEIAEKIRSSVEAHSFIYNNKKELSVTLSIGVSEMNSSVETYEDLLQHAADALKEAKKYGRNRVIIWSNSIQSHNKSTEDEKNHRDLVSSFSPTMDEISITIIKLDSENKETKWLTSLPGKETLNFIRIKLQVCDDGFRMGANCYFMTKDVQILRNAESKFNLLQIITRENNIHVLYIKESAKFDLLQLTDEKGFKFDTEGSIKNAEKKAFKININKIEPPLI
ncbi:18702_t:CDS:2, partial [Gigaspora rosea]